MRQLNREGFVYGMTTCRFKNRTILPSPSSLEGLRIMVRNRALFAVKWERSSG